jgi:hypothetical protein
VVARVVGAVLDRLDLDADQRVLAFEAAQSELLTLDGVIEG